MEIVKQWPELAPVFDHADHIDVKTVEGALNLRPFLAGMLSFQPGWVSFLYGVRSVFVRFLGMRQNGIPHVPKFRPDTIPMAPGQKAAFFTVRMAREDRFWVAEVDDSHLKAALCVVMQPG